VLAALERWVEFFSFKSLSYLFLINTSAT
jgi:hypothetical protein